MYRSIPQALPSFCSEATRRPSAVGPEATQTAFGPASYRSASCNELPNQSSRYTQNGNPALNSDSGLRDAMTPTATGGGDLGRPPHPQIVRAALSGGGGSSSSFSSRRLGSASSFQRNMAKARNVETASGSNSKLSGWDLLLKSPRVCTSYFSPAFRKYSAQCLVRR
ncbi:unnamed protein product [Schistocephalus solidus]|uniref:Uncharacterized protein n=1 Tax=Schistocephalus solidus TaxID=70667 RepID=A0A183TSU5_SCHSO|nr:unnamed protein product [Schistocephalus solidus]